MLPGFISSIFVCGAPFPFTTSPIEGFFCKARHVDHVDIGNAWNSYSSFSSGIFHQPHNASACSVQIQSMFDFTSDLFNCAVCQ